MSHVGWPQLLTVSIWQRTSISILESGQTVDAFADDPVASAIWDQYHKQLEAQLAVYDRTHRSDEEATSEGPALDAYFGRVAASLGAQAAAQAAKSPQAGALLTALNAVVQQRPCTTCSGPSAQAMCQWTRSSESNDLHILGSRGHCMQSVNELFELARTVANSAYRSALGKEMQQALELTTTHGDRDLQLDSAVGALTWEIQPVKSRRVQASFDVSTLRMHDFLALYYVFVHECLVHGYCGVNVSAADAIASRSFHDGWMDCVAAHYVDASLPEGASYPTVSRFLQMFRGQMQRVRSVRYDTTRGAAAADARKWTRGSDAFHTALELFQVAVDRLDRPPATAIDHLLAFSLQLNASSVSHKRRGEFSSTLATVFWRNNDYDRGAALLGNSQVVDFIVDFFLYGDTEALVDRVVTTRWVF